MTPEPVVAKFSLMLKKPVGAVTKLPLNISVGTCAVEVVTKLDTSTCPAEWSNVETLFGTSLPVTLKGPPK
jgi:hypothetical protein